MRFLECDLGISLSSLRLGFFGREKASDSSEIMLNTGGTTLGNSTISSDVLLLSHEDVQCADRL